MAVVPIDFNGNTLYNRKAHKDPCNCVGMQLAQLYTNSTGKSGCCIIQDGSELRSSNITICSISWQHSDSLDIAIGWQLPHTYLNNFHA